ncbi:MAG: hypothetical protein GY714_22885 [Desulfobacterales bacterium]|nr:hypothetical protein [Desulfobacterales bacterium]
MFRFFKISILLVLFFLPSIAFAESNPSENLGAFIEGGMNEDDANNLRFGLCVGDNPYFTGLIGLEFLDRPDNYSGITIGFRTKTPYVICPFIGIHGFVGAGRDKTFDGTKDGVDNDNDGTKDESDEESFDEYKDTFLSALCPEAGLAVKLGDEYQLILSAKYYFTDKGDEYNYWIYNIGFQASF